MSRKYDELLERFKNVDKSQVKQLLGEVNQAREDGEIDDDERKKLLASAKLLISGVF